MGTINTYCHYRQSDLTSVFNKSRSEFFTKGVLGIPAIIPAPLTLAVRVFEFMAIAADGMIVEHKHTLSPTQLSVSAGTLQYVLLHAKYNPSGDPIANLEVMTAITYNALPSTTQNEYIRLCSIYIPPAQTVVNLSDINYTGAQIAGLSTLAAEIIDPVGRESFRGSFDTAFDLPYKLDTGSLKNKNGDTALTRDTGYLWYWKENLAVSAHGTWTRVTVPTDTLLPNISYHRELLSPFEMPRSFMASPTPSVLSCTVVLSGSTWPYAHVPNSSSSLRTLWWHIKPPTANSRWEYIRFSIKASAATSAVWLSLLRFDASSTPTKPDVGDAPTVVAETSKIISDTSWDTIEITSGFAPPSIAPTNIYTPESCYIIELKLPATNKTFDIAFGKYSSRMIYIPSTLEY